MKVSSLLAAVVLSLLLPGCQTPPPAPGPAPDPPRVCTNIGCSDGLTVVVANAPAAPYTVEVILPDDTRRTARCEARPCNGGLFFEGVTSEELTVRITDGAGSSSQVVHPTYHVAQPNGPGCPPTCRQARVQVRYAP